MANLVCKSATVRDAAAVMKNPDSLTAPRHRGNGRPTEPPSENAFASSSLPVKRPLGN